MLGDLRTVPNPERGCGQLKEGGFYARSDSSPDGVLNAWTWALGSHIISSLNYTMTVPARQMLVTRLPEMLWERRLVAEAMTLTERMKLPRHLDRLPPVALLDHVGTEFYTPYSFAQEVQAHGPSRRIPENIARHIARHTPLPIFFTHAAMPIADSAVVAKLASWGGVPDGARYAPTPYDAQWGLTVNEPYKGNDHWIIPVLHRMNEFGDVHISRMLGAELAEDVLFEEQLIGASWITRVVYIAREDDSTETLSDLLAAGVEPVRVENVSE